MGNFYRSDSKEQVKRVNSETWYLAMKAQQWKGTPRQARCLQSR